MKLLKKFISIFLALQVIASCVGSTASCWEFRKKHFVKKGGLRPKVSVIVPIYKAEPWIRECLNSLKNQTLKDLEFICVDDGSPDNCGKILDEYAKIDNRFIVIHQKNQGVSAARNAGLKLAKGEYITFVDPDDYLILSAYEVAYNAAENDNVDILQFGYRSFIDGQDDHILEQNVSPNGRVFNRDAFLRLRHPSFVWNKLFKADLIKKDNVEFSKSMNYCEDVCFSYMVFGRAKKVKIIPNKLYNYRKRTDGLSAIDIETQFLKAHKMLKLICNDWRKFGYSVNHEHVLLHRLVRWAFYRRPFALKYAKEILNSFGPDIYNSEVIKKCPVRIQYLIKELEHAEKNPDFFQNVSQYTHESPKYLQKLLLNQHRQVNSYVPIKKSVNF